MSGRGTNLVHHEQVSLYRARSVVTGMLGAFGNDLKETRLTAFLGYLVALRSESFRDLLGFEGALVAVELETSQEGGRTDIVIEISRDRCVLEAKVGAFDPRFQASRY